MAFLRTNPIQLLKLVSAVLIFLLLFSSCQKKPKKNLVWSAIHVSGATKSGDAHLLELPNGKFFLIDTGYQMFFETDLLPYLKSKGVAELSGILVTHSHRNHYGSVVDLVKQIPTKVVYFNPPNSAVCAKEHIGDRCNESHVAKTIKEIKQYSKVEQVKTGDQLINGDEVKLKVIHFANAKPELNFSPINGRFTVNDSSIVSRLEYGDISILFPGDMGSLTGTFVVNSIAKELYSTMLAAPHHGVTDMPPNDFFERVSPEIVVASISPPPFVGERGEIVRQFCKNNNVPLYVTGFGGTFSVEITSSSYAIKTGKPYKL